VYWSALLHLLVINFPYALLAWVYLFVFTLVSFHLERWCFQSINESRSQPFGVAGYHPSRRSPTWCRVVLL
jgi:hypothetical protein